MRLTKPAYADAEDIFKYGKECGIDQECDRILSLLEAKRSEFEESHDWADVELLTYLIDKIKGENE